MATYYHVDRRGLLSPNSIYGLTHYSDIDPEFLQRHADKLFPEGFTVHGERYFLKNDSLPVVTSPAIELIFEYVRRASFPNRPSRFQSLFAWNRISDAGRFRDQYGNHKDPIWIVEYDENEAFKGDMNLLGMRDSLLVTSYRAHCYWGGLPDPSGDPPRWEFLLKAPVGVIKRV
jgi:hypothetical protein